jgi:hypothetical protein
MKNCKTLRLTPFKLRLIVSTAKSEMAVWMAVLCRRCNDSRIAMRDANALLEILSIDFKLDISKFRLPSIDDASFFGSDRIVNEDHGLRREVRE